MLFWTRGILLLSMVLAFLIEPSYVTSAGAEESIPDRLKAAASALGERRYQDAVHEYEWLVKALPDEVEIRSNLGIAYYLSENYVQAIIAVWVHNLTAVQGLCSGTAVRHFNVMHHMLGRAATVWTKDTGLTRNPADEIEIRRPDDQRDRFLLAEELPSLKKALDGEAFGPYGGDESPSARVISWDHYRMRLIVLAALTTGMRLGEIFALYWSDLDYGQGLIAVRSHLKNGKTRYVPMSTELAEEFRRFPQVFGEERIFPPKLGAKSGRQRVDRSFKNRVGDGGVDNFRFHDLRHTFASWYMMNGGDLYELAKILGHANIKMTERYAKLAKQHIARTGNTAREMWRMMEKREGQGSERVG